MLDDVEEGTIVVGCSVMEDVSIPVEVSGDDVDGDDEVEVREEVTDGSWPGDGDGEDDGLGSREELSVDVPGESDEVVRVLDVVDSGSGSSEDVVEGSGLGSRLVVGSGVGSRVDSGSRVEESSSVDS